MLGVTVADGYVAEDGRVFCGVCVVDHLASASGVVMPIDPNSEWDHPVCCDDCHILIDTKLTSEGVAYLARSIWDWNIHSVGNYEVLRDWAESFADYNLPQIVFPGYGKLLKGLLAETTETKKVRNKRGGVR